MLLLVNIWYYFILFSDAQNHTRINIITYILRTVDSRKKYKYCWTKKLEIWSWKFNLVQIFTYCVQNAISTIVGIEGIADGTRNFVACNHMRAIHFFIESIGTNCPFTGNECTSYGDYRAGKCLTCPSGVSVDILVKIKLHLSWACNLKMWCFYAVVTIKNDGLDRLI